MHFRRNVSPRRQKYLFASILVLFISVIYVAFGMGHDDDYASSRREILLRRIGHEILLQSGDSTSRVLPVKKIAGNEYQISVENDFTFQPDSLISTTQRLLSKDPLASDYIVNVLNCATASVAYGYAISKNKKDDIITCQKKKAAERMLSDKHQVSTFGNKYSKEWVSAGRPGFISSYGLYFF